MGGERENAAIFDLETSASSDRYTVVGELARGGLGRVFSATDDELGRPVAIKMPIAPTAAARARFEREAKITARLQHSGVVPVYDVGRLSDGQPFFVMKLVEGRSLADLVEQAISEDDRLGLLPTVLSVAETLAYAHQQGVIHRDLKPANVIRSDYGETVVIDWGLGRVIDDPEDMPPWDDDQLGAEERPGLTEDGLVLGTPEFMPPEQAQGKPADERGDVYAIGAMLFNVLAGRPPFTGDSKSAVLARVRLHPPPPLSGLVPRLPSDLLTIVAKAMARDPADRYHNAGELADDLRRFLDGQLVRAHRYSLHYLAVRWLRKHRVVVALAAIMLAGALTAGVLGARRIVVERNAALAARRAVESRENALVLQHAQRSVDNEPTAALAWLKRHWSSSDTDWLARAVAEEAVARGVARHIFAFPGPSPAVAVSATAPLLAVGGKDGSIRVFRLDTGASQELGRQQAAIIDLAFCPEKSCLASLDARGQLTLWAPDGGRQAMVTLAPSATGHIKFSTDGARIAVNSGLNDLVVLSTKNPSERRRLQLPDLLSSFGFCSGSDTVLALDFEGRVVASSPGRTDLLALPGRHPDARLLCLADGDHFVTGGVDGAVKLWHRLHGLVRVLGRHRAWVTSLAASPDGRSLASGSGDDTVMLFDLRANTTRVLHGHRDTVRDLTFTGDGKILATVAYDATVIIWQVPTGEAVGSFRTSNRRSTRLHLTSDGRSLVASGNTDALVWLLPLAPDRVLRGHRGAIISIDWSPDGRLLAGGGRDQAVHVWDVASGLRIGGGVLDSWVKLVRFMDNQRVLASTRSARTSLFDWRSDRLDPVVSPGPATAALTSIAVSPDRKRLAYARGKRMWLQDIATGAKLALADPPPDVKNIAFSPDGAHVLVASLEGVLGVWRTDSGLLVLRRQLGERPSELTLSPDGRWVAVRTELGGLLLWDRLENDLRDLPTDGLSVGRQSFTRDSRRVVYTLANAGIRMFDALDRRGRTLRGHRSPITELVLSPDQASMASGDEAGFVRIWNLRTGDASLLRPLTGPIQRLAFSPAGDRLAVAGNDLSIEIWNVPGQTPPAAGSVTWLRAQTSAEVDDRGYLRTPQTHSAMDPR